MASANRKTLTVRHKDAALGPLAGHTSKTSKVDIHVEMSNGELEGRLIMLSHAYPIALYSKFTREDVPINVKTLMRRLHDDYELKGERWFVNIYFKHLMDEY